MSASRLIFVNLPVRDLSATRAFYGALGFEFNEMFSDDTCACMVVSEQAYVMLLTEGRFAEFVTRPVADPGRATGAIMAVSADSREGVDDLADRALEAGATPSGEPTDHGFMYARDFHDLDGHHWSVVWMDPKAVEQGPADMADTAA